MREEGGPGSRKAHSTVMGWVTLKLQSMEASGLAADLLPLLAPASWDAVLVLSSWRVINCTCNSWACKAFFKPLAARRVMTSFKMTDRSFWALSVSSYEWNLWASYWMVEPVCKDQVPSCCHCCCLCVYGWRGRGEVKEGSRQSPGVSPDLAFLIWNSF